MFCGLTFLTSPPATIPADMYTLLQRQQHLVRAICLLLIASIAGCQAGDLVSAVGSDVPDPAQAKMREIAVAIQTASVGQDQLIQALSGGASSFDVTNGDDTDIPVLTASEVQDLADFYADPEPRLLEIYLQENQGADKIDLLHAIYTKQDYSEVRVTLTKFLTEDEIVSLDAQVAEVETAMAELALTTDASGKVMVNQVALHFMAGAAVTLLVAGVAYSIIPWWRPVSKIAAVAAFGFVSVVFAGAAKEVYDSHHPATNTVDLRGDFMRTFAGSAVATIFVVGTFAAARAVSIRPTTAAIFWIVSGAIIGRPVVLNLLRP